jgi:hypothetical protein
MDWKPIYHESACHLHLHPSTACLSQWLRACQLSRSSDDDITQRLITRSSPCRFDLPYDIHAVKDFAKHDVLTIKMRRRSGEDEELRTIGVWAAGQLVPSL